MGRRVGNLSAAFRVPFPGGKTDSGWRRMWKWRVTLSLVLFALAGLAGLIAWFVGSGGLIWQLAMGAAAVFLAWKGCGALWGRMEPPPRNGAGPDRSRPAGVPGPDGPPTSAGAPRAGGGSGDVTLAPPDAAAWPGSHEVAKATGSALAGALRVMGRTVVVLLLVILVPAMIGLFVWGIVELSKGHMVEGIALPLAAVFLASYCWGPLRDMWTGGSDESDSSGTPEHGRPGHGSDGVVIADPLLDPALPLPELSLPEEFLLLCHIESGEVLDAEQARIGCAVAELGELALRRRLQAVPDKKFKVFGIDAYWRSGRIRLLDTTPTGLAWADGILAELERRTTAEGESLDLREWLLLRGEDAFLHHRSALLDRTVLLHDHSGELHYADAALRNAFIARLRAVVAEQAPLDEHMLFLWDLVDASDVAEHLGLRLRPRQRLDRAKGSGAVAALPEDVRDTSTVLSFAISKSRQTAPDSGGGDGGGE